MRVFMLLSVTVAAALAQDTTEGTPLERPRVWCGRLLADARLVLCFAERARKHSFKTAVAESVPRWVGSLWPWLVHARSRYEGAQAPTQRSKREAGLVDECCLKPCYMRELLQYC